jgi:hypothetical protein
MKLELKIYNQMFKKKFNLHSEEERPSDKWRSNYTHRKQSMKKMKRIEFIMTSIDLVNLKSFGTKLKEIIFNHNKISSDLEMSHKKD